MDPVPYTFARDFQRVLLQPIPAWFFERMVGEALRVPQHLARAGRRHYST